MSMPASGRPFLAVPHFQNGDFGTQSTITPLLGVLMFALSGKCSMRKLLVAVNMLRSVRHVLYSHWNGYSPV